MTPSSTLGTKYWRLVPALSALLVAAETAGPGVSGAASGLLAATLKLEAKAVLVASAGLAVLATALAVLGDGLSGGRSWGRRCGARVELAVRTEEASVVG